MHVSKLAYVHWICIDPKHMNGRPTLYCTQCSEELEYIQLLSQFYIIWN